MKDGVEALRLLFFIVIQCGKSDAAQEQDRDDVDDRFETHGNIRKIPGDTQAVACTDKDHDSRRDPENSHGCFVFCDKKDVCLRIEIITDNGGKSKQADDDRHKMDPDGSDDPGYALLQERDSRITGIRPVTSEQDQEDCRGADQQGINVNRNDLRQALLGRV